MNALLSFSNFAVFSRVTLLTLLASSGGSFSFAAGDVEENSGTSAAEILTRADEIRFPTQGFQASVSIITVTTRHPPERREYQILSKGNDNTLIMTTAPAVEKGQILLMKARDLWIFVPQVSQPVRLPLSQRLSGQVSNGDLARSNFTGDYAPRILRIESIDDKDYYLLELSALRRNVTYHRVLYWINKANYRPHKAEFYTLSGRLLKTCEYKNFKNIGGGVRPTTLVMKDTLAQGEKSILEYSELRLRELPDKIFTKDYLKKLM